MPTEEYSGTLRVSSRDSWFLETMEKHTIELHKLVETTLVAADGKFASHSPTRGATFRYEDVQGVGAFYRYDHKSGWLCDPERPNREVINLREVLSNTFGRLSRTWVKVTFDENGFSIIEAVCPTS